ncbi:hypothetical protein K32_15730 [Kaistia sp. 32K]|nr:hypothetical protein K32_15730 [Kaistia sp. 32K]
MPTTRAMVASPFQPLAFHRPAPADLRNKFQLRVSFRGPTASKIAGYATI